MKLFKNLKRMQRTKPEGVEAVQTVQPAPAQVVRGGRFAAMKPKAKIITILAAFACCVTALILGITGITGSTADASTAYNTTRDYILLEDGKPTQSGTLYKNGLAALFRRLTNDSSCTTLSAFETKLKDHSKQPEGATASYYMYTSSDYRENNNDRNLLIRFGGIDWLLGAVSIASRSDGGYYEGGNHIIATLVMADTNQDVYDANSFSSHNNYTATGKNAVDYPCAMYSTSRVRYYLAEKGNYSSDGSTLTAFDNTSKSSDTGWQGFQSFTRTYKQYIVQPKYVGWQAYQTAKGAGDSHDFSNDGYIGYGNGTGNYNLTGKKCYGEWKEDYLWIPSIAEIGGRTDDAQRTVNSVKSTYKYSKSIFQTDLNFRKCTNQYWTRSQSCENSNKAYSISAGTKNSSGNIAGAKKTNTALTTSCYTRACMHLDLTALYNRTSNVSNSPSHSYWNSYSGMYKASDQLLYASYTGETQTAIAAYYGDYVYPSSNSSSHSVSAIQGSSSSYATPYWYYYTKSGYWFNNGLDYETMQIKMYRAVLNLGFNSTSLKYTGSAQAPSITSISAKSSAASKVSNTVSSTFLPSSSDFTIYYYGTLANGSTWRTRANKTTTKPTEVGSYTMVVQLNDKSYSYNTQAQGWGYYYRYNFTLNEAYADPTVYRYNDSTYKNSDTYYNVYQREYSFTINYGDITSYNISALSGTYKGTSQKLISSYSATTNTTQTWQYSRNGSSWSTLSTSSYPSEITAGSYTVYVRVSAPYYNTLTVTRTATIGKKNISSGVGWSTISSYGYNGSAKTPTPTVTAVDGYTVTSSTSDFSYSYSNNVNVGTATVTVTAKSTSTNYTGTASRTFTITKGSVSPHTWFSSQGTGVTRVDDTHLTATYSGAQTYAETASGTAKNDPLISFSFSSSHLSWLSSRNDRILFTNAGTYYVYQTLKDTSNYQWSDGTTGTKTLYITVSKKAISSGVTWSSIGSYTYDGNSKTPKPTITAVGSNSVTTSADSDFSYTYSNNTSAGTATVTISAKSTSTNFTGSTSRTFTIGKQSIAAPYWLDSQDDGIVKSGTTLTATFNNTKRSFKAYEASNAPSPYNSSGNIDGNSSNYSSQTRTMYATNAGTYTVTWRLSSTANQVWSTGSTADIVLTIKINKVSVGTSSVTSGKVYTGNPVPNMPTGISFSTTVVNAPTIEQLIYCTYSGTANDGTSYSSSTTAPTKAGTYKAVRNINSAYANNYSVSTSSTYTITRAYVTVNWQTNTLNFNGSAQRPSMTLSFASSVATSARPTESNFTFSGLGTEPGNYTVTAVLATAYAYNFQINGSTCTSFNNSSYTNTYCTRNFNIGDVRVEKPFMIEMSGYTLSSDKLSTTVTFNNDIQTFKVYESVETPSPNYTCTVEGYAKEGSTRTISIKNAGTYVFTYHISDDPAMRWPDGTNGDVVITIVVNKIKITSLKMMGYYGATYDGNSQGSYLTSYGLENDIVDSPAIEDLFSASYTGTTASGASYSSSQRPIEAGTYHVDWKVAADYKNNYKHSSGDTYYWINDFTVSKRSLSDETVGFTDINAYTYSGTANTPTPLVNKIGSTAVASPESAFTYTYANNTNAGTATVTVTAVDKSNYSGSKALTFTINKALITGVDWDKEVFTYTGKVQCPKITAVETKDELPAEIAPVAMFEITGGQADAGLFTATAALKPAYAGNFTTSATDPFVTVVQKEYEIERAYLELNFDNVSFTYNGSEQLPDFTLNTNSDASEKGGMAIDIIARDGSHLLNGTAIDVGQYTIQVSMAGSTGTNYFKQVNGAEAEDGTWTINFEILPTDITAVWSGTEFTYNGAKQGAFVERFDGAPADGSDPFLNLEVTYYSGGVALTDTPVHAGHYTTKIALANGNYRLVDEHNNVIAAATKDFVINSVSFEENGGSINWEHFDDIVFNGLPQGVSIDGYTTGLFTADASRALNLEISYAKVDDEGVVGAFTTRQFSDAGNYMVRIRESFGDYLFKDVPFSIAKRKVTVLWKGDEESRLDGDTIRWLYDGEMHSPSYSVKFDGNDFIYRDGKKISTLEIIYGKVISGMATLTAQLVDNGYNSNFELIEESQTQKIEVERFRATAIDWYEEGSKTPLTALQLAALHYESSKVYGENGPRLKAVAKTDFVTDNGAITREIELVVTYPDAVEGYWEVGDTHYKAVASFASEDEQHCEFSDSVKSDDDDGDSKVFVTFIVTDDRTDHEKLTITWSIEVDDEEIPLTDIGQFDYSDGYGWLNGVFTFLYDGTERFPIPVAMGEYNNLVELTVGGTENCVNAGNGHIVHIVPLSGYEISASDSEYRFNILPRPVFVEWFGDNSFTFGENPNDYIEVESDEELSTCTIASGDQFVLTFDSLNVGTRTATALVYRNGVPSQNYVLTNNTKKITINRRPVSASSIDWSKSLECGATAAVDGNGNTYYVWSNDGNVHAPVAELVINVGGEEKTLKLTVMGAQSATGSYIAYAIFDYRDEYSSNFLLVEDESAATPVETIAKQRFDISRMVIESITWKASEDAEEAEKISYEYDGKEHLPYAVGVTDEGNTVVLSVFGAQINAGTYTARVTGDCDFADGVEPTVEFSITPKKVKVEWLGFDEKNEIHLTYDGKEKHPAVKVEGGLTEDDYFVTGFVNAGTYVASIVFTNTNFSLDDSENANAGVCEFTIDRRAINVSWTGVGNYTPSGAVAGVMYWEYNGSLRGPVASGSYNGITFGEEAANKIIVSGRATNAGSYVAEATLDYGVAANANFTLVNASKRFEITPYLITVVWTGNENAEGAFEWEFDGAVHHPKAKYQLWSSAADEWIEPAVQGAKSDVGEYIASIALPANCAFKVVDGNSCGEQAFSITKQKITKINWYDAAEGNLITDVENFSFEYNGKSQLPVAYADGTGEELVVTGARINAGTGYIATAMLKEAGNYELSANANTSYTFGISQKAVEISWVDGSDKGGFTWTYTGNIICPTAEFTDVDGNTVAVTVTGSNVNSGTYLATAHDTFLNYYFVDDEGNEITPTKMFAIEALSLGDDFKWLANGGSFTAATEGGNDTYSFEYDGKAHQPLVECTVEGKTIIFSYTVSSESGHVDAIVNAGTYTVTVKSSDVNYTVPEGKATVTVVITPKEVSAVWGATTLEYTGSAQVPTAYYVDVHGQTVALKVTSATPVTTGTGYATAAFADTDNAYGNYVLAAAEPKEFTISAKTTGNLKWDWTTGKFVEVTDGGADASSDNGLEFENVA